LLVDVVALGGCFNGNLPCIVRASRLRGRSEHISAVTHTAPADIE